MDTVLSTTSTIIFMLLVALVVGVFLGWVGSMLAEKVFWSQDDKSRENLLRNLR